MKTKTSHQDIVIFFRVFQSNSVALRIITFSRHSFEDAFVYDFGALIPHMGITPHLLEGKPEDFTHKYGYML